MRLKVPVVLLKVWFLPLSWPRNQTRPSCLLTQRHTISMTTGSLCSYDQKAAPEPGVSMSPEANRAEKHCSHREI